MGLYQRVKASWIYDCYWTFADRRLIDDRRAECNFYRNLLVGFRKGDLIFDVGANQGYKAQIFMKLGARVVAVEPDLASQTVLRDKFQRYRLARKPITIVDRAVSETKSTTTMWIDTPGSALNTLSRKWTESLRTDEGRFGKSFEFGQEREVETVSIEDLVTLHGAPFFVKIDVEGHELNVLRGMRRAVPYLSFEVNLPDFRAEGLECVRVLNKLASDGEFNYTFNCRLGLAMSEWLSMEEFAAVLESCNESSIEVFWRTKGQIAAVRGA